MMSLDQQTAELFTNVAKYERTNHRNKYRASYYSCNLPITDGAVSLKVFKLKGIYFRTAIIERYCRRESSVEEAITEIYLTGGPVRGVADITEFLCGSKVSSGAISNLNKKAYVNIEQ